MVGMKARSVEIFDDQGNLDKIEVTLETGVHLFDAVWDPTDEQNEDNRIAFREWVKRVTLRNGHELT
jgi:hypothetical protein